MKEEILAKIEAWPDNFKQDYRSKIDYILRLLNREPLTNPIKELINREVAQLERRLEEQKSSVVEENQNSQLVEKLVLRYKAEQTTLTETTYDEILKYGNDILGSLIDSEYGQLVILELHNLIKKQPCEFSAIISFIDKIDNVAVSKESLLYYADIVSGNFEFFDYAKWLKLSKNPIAEIKNEVTAISKKFIAEVVNLIPEARNNQLEQFRSVVNAKSQSDLKWTQVKLRAKTEQELADLEMARGAIYETINFYLFNARKLHLDLEDVHEQEVVDYESRIKDQLERIKEIIDSNNDTMIDIYRKPGILRRFLCDLMTLRPYSNEIIKLILSQVINLVSSGLDIRTSNAILSTIRSIPGIVGFLHRKLYTAEEINFLHKFLNGALGILELSKLSKNIMKLYFGTPDKIEMFEIFKAKEDREFLQDCLKNRDMKCGIIFQDDVRECLRARFILPEDLRKWSSDKIIQIGQIIYNTYQRDIGDRSRLSKLYDETYQDFRRLLLNPIVNEALRKGYCSLQQYLEIKPESKREVIFSNQVMMGCRKRLVTIGSLALLNSDDIRLLTHTNSCNAMEYGKASFTQLFEMLKKNRAQFMYVTSHSASSEYEKGKSFQAMCDKYNKDPKTRHCNNKYYKRGENQSMRFANGR